MTTSTDCVGGGGGAPVTPFVPPASPLVPHAWLGYRYQLVQRLVARHHAEVWSARDAHRGEDAEVTVLVPADADPRRRLAFLERAHRLSLVSHPAVAPALDYGEGAVALPTTPPPSDPDQGQRSGRGRLGSHRTNLLGGRAPEDGPATAGVRRAPHGRLGAPAGRPSRMVVAYVATPATIGVPIARIPARGTPLAVARCLDLIAQAARALEAVHQAGLVHGGIRSSNLFVGRQHRLTIVDFPLGRDPEDPALQPGQPGPAATYTAPELSRPGAAATPLSDIYALGVVAYECLTGRRPFDDVEAAAIAAAPWGAEPPQLPGHLPPDVRWVVSAAMQPDPHRRLKSAVQFADALAGLAARLSAGDAEPTVTLRRLDEADGTAEPGRHQGRERSVSAEVLPWLSRGVRTVLTGRRRSRGLPGRLVTAAAIALVLVASARVVQVALQPTANQPNRIVLHMVDGARNAASGSDAPALPAAAPAMGSTRELTSVPDLSRLPLALARQTLATTGLVLGRTLPRDSPDVLKNTVVGTGPAAGAKVTPGSRVDVYVSTGQIRVPDLGGRPLPAAEELLRGQLHLQVRVLWRGHPDPARGVVVGQSARNVSVPQDSVVTLVAQVPAAPAGVPQLPAPGTGATPAPTAPVPPPATPTTPPSGPVSQPSATETASPSSSPATDSPTAPATP